MSDDECVRARAAWLGEIKKKRKSLWLSSATSPVCLFTVDSLHGSCFQLHSIYPLKRFLFETWRLNVSTDVKTHFVLVKCLF